LILRIWFGHRHRRLAQHGRPVRAEPVLAEPDPQDQPDAVGTFPRPAAPDGPVLEEYAADAGEPAQHVVHRSVPLKETVGMMARYRASERGMSLLIVLLVMMLLSAIMIGFMTNIMADTRS